jgi:uncharacterized protein YbgA (DUF1722 family)
MFNRDTKETPVSKFNFDDEIIKLILSLKDSKFQNDKIKVLLHFNGYVDNELQGNYKYYGMGELISPRKNGHLTKRPFVLQNTPGLNNQV